MKQTIYISIFFLLVLFSCKKNQDDTYATYDVSVQVQDILGNNLTEISGVDVRLTSTTNNSVYSAKSDATGNATFKVPAGLYQVSAGIRVIEGTQLQTYNAVSLPTIQVPAANINPNEVTKTEIKVDKVKSSQVLIKEAYVGGVPKDDGSGNVTTDGYIILYNNSDTLASFDNLCIATIGPANAQGTNNFYVGDKLLYEDEKWMPALSGFWYFQENITIQPGKQIVIALHNAVNNTLTYSKSINFDNAAYYAMYDIASGYSLASYYSSPAASIPTSHYLKAAKYGTGTAWVTSFTSPGLFIFETKGTTPAAFGADASAISAISTAYTSKKVPTDWIVDGVEAYLLGNSNNKKRFLSDVDAGYVYHTNVQGYSIYRNVDKTATEAIADNSGKLVYNYNLGTVSIGTGGTTDPSGIDAEASIKNGARIVYLDNNNSTQDFHLRSKASLRTN